MAWGQAEPQIEWFNTYGDSISEWLVSVDNALYEGYIVAGQAYAEVNVGNPMIGFLAKIDSLGNEEWINYYENIMDSLSVLFIESDSRYMVAGRTRVNDPHGGDLIVMKLDSFDLIDWRNMYKLFSCKATL